VRSPDTSRARRLAAHREVSAALAARDEGELRALVAAGTPHGSGIGGRSVLLEVGGVPVFAKQVPLTDIERRPEHTGSTANLFGLPPFCQYGFGSPGFGAWRELAVHEATTAWALAGEYDGFPLTYHWRVLPGPRRPLPAELADVERAVAYWGGDPAVRRRIESLREATASLTFFLEYVPHDLHTWLRTQVAAGAGPAERACAMVERELAAGVAFMNDRGLLHFDAHFANVLTDGERLFFADYGLALSSDFDLSAAETAFFERHRGYDRCYTLWHLVSWLVAEVYGHDPDARADFVHACAKGATPEGMPAVLAGIVTRHAPLADAMGTFLRTLRRESRTTPYPHEELTGLLRAAR
jgi:hypothetical protein